jgi:cob(I)alamin adenosyltransferase
MKIYTRRGDGGETDLLGGRVAKDDPRVEAYGAVDELNAVLGVCAAQTRQEDVRALVQAIQSALFELGSYLASPDDERRRKAGIPEPDAAEVTGLEDRIDAFEAELEPLKRFILPGGSAAAAAFHLARTVCRRAERAAVSLHRAEPLHGASLRYLNRLSSSCWRASRTAARACPRSSGWAGRADGWAAPR